MLKFIMKRRLLNNCYVLDAQKRHLFPQQSLVPHERISGLNLPFICSTNFWDSATPTMLAARRDINDFPYVSEILSQSSVTSSPLDQPYDAAKSALLVAAASENDPTDLNITRLEATSHTRLLYLATTLAHFVPLRALLAVAGETWIIGEKLATNDQFQILRAELRAWTSRNVDSDRQSHERSSPAIDAALRILQLEMEKPSSAPLTPTLIEQWAVYLAALMLWACVYSIQHSAPNPGILASQREQETRDPRMPVAAVVAAVEQGRWDDVVAGRGVMEVTNWVRGRLNGSSNGLIVEAVLVLGKLVERGGEPGWF
jgi:hypothetical protein